MSESVFRSEPIPENHEIFTICKSFERLHDHVLIVQIGKRTLPCLLQFDLLSCQNAVQFEMELLRVRIVHVFLVDSFFNKNKFGFSAVSSFFLHHCAIWGKFLPELFYERFVLWSWVVECQDDLFCILVFPDKLCQTKKHFLQEIRVPKSD